MKRRMFLDDNPRRREWFIHHIGAIEDKAWLAADAPQAIAILQAPEHAEGFDEVFLDHDLGEEAYADSDREDTGMEVVRWIVANKPRIGLVVVHTMNTPAAHAMVRALSEGGYLSYYQSFYQIIHGASDHVLS